jgi:hypothetical protein
MSLTLGCNRIQIQDHSRTVYVPENDLAKLMYYLKCVSNVLNYRELDKYTDYANYNLLSQEDEKKVYAFALILKPEILLKANVFIIAPNLLTKGSSNQFFIITDERIGVHVSQEVTIGGRAVKVLEVMICNENWIKDNYFQPLASIFSNYNSTETISSFNNNTHNTYRRNINSSGSSDCCSCKKCCLSLCIIIVGIIIIDVLVYKFFLKGSNSESDSSE